MNVGERIPKINSIGIILIILFILNILGGYLITPYLTSIFGAEEFSQYSMTVSVASIVKLSLGYLLNIFLAVWTYREAKRQNEKPVMWTVLTLFFGLIAIVLFYLLLLIKELKILNQKLDNKR
jgi:O-antigen/teichoic acid export membrane protein